ncbi:MAG: sugar phosphate isomerase/epimerase family protein [Thermoguttaceae bacterium]
MKYAICNEMFESWNNESGFDFNRCFRFIRDCGYDGVEIAPFTIAEDVTQIPSSKRKEIRKIAESAGIAVSGIHWLLAKTQGYHLTSPDADVRKKTSNYFIALAELCSELGGEFMVLGSPNQRSLLPGVNLEQAMDYAAFVLEKVVPTLEKTGVKIAVEPLTQQETDFLTTADSTRILLDKIGALEHIALHLDCKAMCGESKPIPQIIRENKDILIYFHLNDPNLQGPGFGNLEFGPIFEALKEIGYTGWASVEPFDYSPGVERLSKDSIQFVKDF